MAAEIIGNITDTYTLHHVALHFDEVLHCWKSPENPRNGTWKIV